MEAALPLTGQTWVWPKYSGATHLNGPHVRVTEAQGVDFDRWYEDLSIPPFSDDEWAEFWSFCERLALEELDIPAREWLKLPETELRHLCPVIRQTYDPDYGGELFEVDVCSHDQHAGSLVFVKKGWGMWTIVEFNDGDGGAPGGDSLIMITLIRRSSSKRWIPSIPTNLAMRISKGCVYGISNHTR